MAGLVAAVLFQTAFFLRTLHSPWTDLNDFNGAVWSQAAHNLLAAGFAATAGAPAPFYFGPMPIPDGAYYCHHPSLLAMMVAGAFAVFGEAEWAARLVPVLFSTASVVLLWLLVRSCLGSAAAAFSAMAFVALPMELRFGQMVNFEPCTLTWMLAGFLGLRYAGLTGLTRWNLLALAGFALAMQTAWLGYFVAGAVALDALLRGKWRLPVALGAMALTAGGLFLLQMRQVQPGLFSDLASASWLRFGHSLGSGHTFTFAQWTARVSGKLLGNIPMLFLALGILGAGRLWNGRSREGVRWAAWMCGIMAAMSAAYVIGFRNASYVHEYAAFYLVVPAAVLAGVGGHWLATVFRQLSPHAGRVICGLTLAGMAANGAFHAEALRMPARILDVTRPEPETLIPELGKTIRAEFPPGAHVLTNIGSCYTPQLWYYSSRPVLNNLTQAAHWRVYIAKHPQQLYGIVWLGAPGSDEIIQASHAEAKAVLVAGVPFCVLKRESQ